MAKPSYRKCFICGEFILDDYTITALEIPYINLFSHRECKKDLSTDELIKYIKEWLKMT